jgi:dihydroflavonol-4-reductase
VAALVPSGEAASDVLDPRATVVAGDVTQPASLRSRLDGCDACFHLAALVAPWVRRPSEFFRVNVGGTEAVIGEALRSRVGRFVFTSSLSGIGVTPGTVLREDSPRGRAFGAYEESKAQAERIVARAHAERGLPAITVIPSIVIGPGDTRNTGRFLLDFVRGGFPGTFAEETVLPVVGVDDVARAHLLAFERGRVGERYIVSAENVRWGELIRIASEVSGVPVPSRHIGARALWLASRVGEALARVTRAPPRMPAWLADFMLTGASMDNSKSVRELGMTYAPIRESIQATVEWFRETGLADLRQVSTDAPVPGEPANPFPGMGEDVTRPAGPTQPPGERPSRRPPRA